MPNHRELIIKKETLVLKNQVEVDNEKNLFSIIGTIV
jgi:putative transposon-encoded protein